MEAKNKEDGDELVLKNVLAVGQHADCDNIFRASGELHCTWAFCNSTSFSQGSGEFCKQFFLIELILN